MFKKSVVLSAFLFHFFGCNITFASEYNQNLANSELIHKAVNKEKKNTESNLS